MKVRAKFKCDRVIENETQVTWEMSPVYADNDSEHENSKFWKYTPCGNLSMGLNKEEYKGQHPVEGKEYYLDISETT